MRNDECAIDVPVFEAFVHALLERRGRTAHAIVDVLSEGFGATVPALAERIGLGVRVPGPPPTLDGFTAVQALLPADPDRPARLRARVLALQRAMPR